MDVAPSCDPQRVGEGYIATPPGGGIHTITISATLTQGRVGLTELAVLSLQGLELGGHVRGQAKLAPAVSLGPANPLMQRLRSATDLARNRDQRCPTRPMFMLVIQNHPYRASSHLRRELVRCLACHGSTLSRVGASGKPGRFTGAGSWLRRHTEARRGLRPCRPGGRLRRIYKQRRFADLWERSDAFRAWPNGG